MEPEIAIDASREAIKVCFMVGGPILGVCLAVGLLMGLAQAMSHIQDQALATVPKILTALAVVAIALPWLADRMTDFAENQFSSPFMAESGDLIWAEPIAQNSVRSLLVAPGDQSDRSYYPTLNAPKLEHGSIIKQASHVKTFSLPNSEKAAPAPSSDGDGSVLKASPNPFSLPSYRYSKRAAQNIEG